MVKRCDRSNDGFYHMHGKKYEMLEGSRAQVWHGTAYKTTGGLTKNDIMQNKNGRIVSRSKHASAKREKRLIRAGYGTQKGKFGAVKLHSSSRKNRSDRGKHHKRRMKGGNVNYSLSPSDYDGSGVGTSGNAVQFAAGNGN